MMSYKELNAFYDYFPPLICVSLFSPAGKSALAARLSRSYGLRHIRAKDLLDPTLLASVDPELQKAVAAEMSGKEPRVSGKNMARLLQT